MQSERVVLAESARLHRFFSPGPSRASLNGDAVLLEGRLGAPVVEIPVRPLDVLNLSSALFCNQVTLKTVGESEHSIGGLDRQSALRLRDEVLREIDLQATDVGIQLKRIDERLVSSLAGDRYIRYSQTDEFADLRAEFASILQECGRLLRRHFNEGASGALEHLMTLDTDEGFEAARVGANKIFLFNSIPKVKEAVSSVLSNPLTDEQAEAIASDEDTTLVLAGAGTGKTAVIVGKIAHLVRNLGVPPREILVMAYNRKARDEIRERLPDDLSAAQVFTFHAFGRRVIAESEDNAPAISDLAEDDKKLEQYIKEIIEELLNNPKQSQDVIRFIANHHAPYQSAFDFATRPEYDEYVRNVELRALSGDLVKSFEELVIANYLTEHGIKFDCERQYEHETATREHRQYKPDFFLPEYNIYIEHFALNEEGLPPPGWKGYLEGVEWKRGVHSQYETKLIETYSWQYRHGKLLPQLHAQLKDAKVQFKRVSLQALIQQLVSWMVSWLTNLLAKFLNHVKSNGLKAKDLRARTRAGSDRDHQRAELFLDVFDVVYARYQQLLAKKNERDFHDLINLATHYIRKGRWESTYRYVLVDEFQDISAGRMGLLRAIGTTDIAYFLVGDDWQSIYRFAGSDVSLMRNCGNHLGHVKEQILSQTFRFGNGILGPSTAFIQRNPEQTQRSLRPASGPEDEGFTVIPCDDPASGLEEALREIAERTGEKTRSVLVLGRYKASREILNPCRQRGSVRVDFSTVHAAKGLEADYAVVLDLKRDRFGFPSQIEDDPLLEIVLPPSSGGGFPYAEERRLFYVAMTRARVGAYLITDSVRPSGFITELLQKSNNLRVIGNLSPECPRCPSGRLLPSKTGKNMRCSNYPNCEHRAPRCPNCDKGYAVVSKHMANARCTNPSCDNPPLDVCPSCGIGVLLVRNGRHGPFWGCSEYPSEPSCRYTMDLVGAGTENNA